MGFGFWLCSAKVVSGNSTEDVVLKGKRDCVCGCVLSRASVRKIRSEQSENKGMQCLKMQTSICLLLTA